MKRSIQHVSSTFKQIKVYRIQLSAWFLKNFTNSIFIIEDIMNPRIKEAANGHIEWET